MAIIIPPGWLQAAYTFSLLDDPEPIVVTCGHKIDSVSGATGAQAPNDLMTSFGTNIVANIMNSAYVLEFVTCYVGNDGPPTVQISTAARKPGGGSALVVPQNTAYLVRKRTDLAGRRGRGRMYLPSVAESNVDAKGTLTAASITAQQGFFDAWFTALTTAAGSRFYPPAVLHRSEGIGVEPAPTLVTKFVVDGRVATQRRRLRR